MNKKMAYMARYHYSGPFKPEFWGVRPLKLVGPSMWAQHFKLKHHLNHLVFSLLKFFAVLDLFILQRERHMDVVLIV